MAVARQRSEWNQVGQICATIANANRGKGSPLRQPEDFIPPGLRPEAPPVEIDLATFAAGITGRKVKVVHVKPGKQ